MILKLSCLIPGSQPGPLGGSLAGMANKAQRADATGRYGLTQQDYGAKIGELPPLFEGAT
jgi:hypothetical protein